MGRRWLASDKALTATSTEAQNLRRDHCDLKKCPRISRRKSGCPKKVTMGSEATRRELSYILKTQAHQAGRANAIACQAHRTKLAFTIGQVPAGTINPTRWSRSARGLPLYAGPNVGQDRAQNPAPSHRYSAGTRRVSPRKLERRSLTSNDALCQSSEYRGC